MSNKGGLNQERVRYQFVPKTLLLVVAVAGLVLVVGLTLRELHREARVLDNIYFSGYSEVEYRWGRIVHLDVRLNKFPLVDSDIHYLLSLRKLERLNLDGQPLTDACLEQIKGMTQLRELSLDETGVTGEGVMKLQDALPACQITR